MKISKILIVAIALLLGFSACTPDNNGGNSVNTVWSETGSPIGEWKLTEWKGSKDFPMGVYIRLSEDNTFDLYQHTYNILWVHYSGTFSHKGNTLTGVYSDGTNWNEYTIKYNDSAEPKQIKLTRKGDTEDVGIYTATEIPAEVIDQASEATAVRSVAIEKFL